MKHAGVERIMFSAVKNMYGIDFFTYTCELNRSSGIEYKFGNLWIRENLVMTSAYAQKTIRTDADGSGKKLSRVVKGILGVYLAFRFGAKL